MSDWEGVTAVIGAGAAIAGAVAAYAAWRAADAAKETADVTRETLRASELREFTALAKAIVADHLSLQEAATRHQRIDKNIENLLSILSVGGSQRPKFHKEEVAAILEEARVLAAPAATLLERLGDLSKTSAADLTLRAAALQPASVRLATLRSKLAEDLPLRQMELKTLREAVKARTI